MIPSVSGTEDVFAVDTISKIYGQPPSFLNRVDSRVAALDGVSFTVQRGESFGIVGESGSGKSTLARILTRLEPATSGHVRFEGRDIARFRGADLLRFRRRVQIVFQNPYSALNPRRSIRQTLTSAYEIHRIGTRADREHRLVELLSKVGLQSFHLDRYPHQMSGGQLQRVVIARALSVEPEVLVADEPVSSLDVSVQAQVLNLLKRLQRDLQLTILLVTHDLRVVNFFCDRVAVFYRGHLVELGPKRDLIRSPRHPYTAALLSSAPAAQVGSRAAPLRGELADEDVTQVGCPFAARCALRERLGNPSLCKTHRPPLHNIEADRLAACHFASDGIGLDQVQPVAPEQAKVAG